MARTKTTARKNTGLPPPTVKTIPCINPPRRLPKTIPRVHPPRRLPRPVPKEVLYSAEYITRVRKRKVGNGAIVEYFVHWHGYRSGHTWEPAESFQAGGEGSQALIQRTEGHLFEKYGVKVEDMAVGTILKASRKFTEQERIDFAQAIDSQSEQPAIESNQTKNEKDDIVGAVDGQLESTSAGEQSEPVQEVDHTSDAQVEASQTSSRLSSLPPAYEYE